MSTTARAEGSHAIPRGRKAGVSSRAPNTSTGPACGNVTRMDAANGQNLNMSRRTGTLIAIGVFVAIVIILIVLSAY